MTVAKRLRGAEAPKVRRLICNADDLGIGVGISDGIFRAHSEGVITSATLMVNMPAADYAVRQAAKWPALSVGVHVNLTLGKPIADPAAVSGLVGPDGVFWPHATQVRRLVLNPTLVDEVEVELKEQIRRAIDLGLKPTHLDSHHGIHRIPVVRAAMIRAANAFGIHRIRTQGGYFWSRQGADYRVRAARVWRNALLAHRQAIHLWNRSVIRRSGIRGPDRMLRPRLLLPPVQDPIAQLILAISALPPGTTEMVFHPGCDDPTVRESEQMSAARQVDLKMMLDPRVREAISESGVVLTSYAEI